MFASEVLGAVAAADDLFAMAITLHELVSGPEANQAAKRKFADGPTCIKTILSTDSMSLFTALQATTTRIPADKGLTIHLYWLKERLTFRVLDTLQWLDTRDMTADGHTNGIIDRQALKDLQSGYWTPKHPTKEFRETASDATKTVHRTKSYHDPSSVWIQRESPVCAQQPA